MATLLHILAHPTPETSLTGQIATAFLDVYREVHPEDTIATLDLYREPAPYLNALHIAAAAKRACPQEMTAAEAAAWQEVTARIDQFAAAQKILITAPMWNYGVPAVLKAYIDLLVQAGLTFRYTEIGMPVGLMTGRRLAIISTRGGIYSQPPLNAFEMTVRFLRGIFDFIGVETVDEIVAEGLALVGPAEQQLLLNTAITHACEAARRL